jgi:hypothetical protein
MGTNTDGNGLNVALVKYDSSGSAQWAQTVAVGADFSNFLSVAADTNGDIFAAGYVDGNGAYDFGRNVTAKGTSENSNSLLVKYNSAGTPQWVQTTAAGSTGSTFWDIACYGSGDIYAVGYINGIDNYSFGSTAVVAGSSKDGGNALLVRY